jgi:hypothetical protein
VGEKLRDGRARVVVVRDVRKTMAEDPDVQRQLDADEDDRIDPLRDPSQAAERLSQAKGQARYSAGA